MESNVPKSTFNDSDNGIIEKHSEIQNFDGIKDGDSFSDASSSQSINDDESEESAVKLKMGSKFNSVVSVYS